MAPDQNPESPPGPPGGPHQQEFREPRSLAPKIYRKSWILGFLGVGLGALGTVKSFWTEQISPPSPQTSALEPLVSPSGEHQALMMARPKSQLGDSHPLDSALQAKPILVETPERELPPSVSKETLDSLLLMQAKFATGDFDGALAIAERLWEASRALNDSKVADYIEAQLPAILVSSAWSHIRFGRYEQAIELLLKSRKFRPLDEATKGLALSYYKLRRVEEALEEAESYLKKNPTDEVILLVVSDLYESQNRFQESLEVLLKAEQKITDQLSQKGLAPQEQKELLDNLGVIKNQKKKAGEKLQLSKNQKQELNGLFKLSYSELEHDVLAGWVLDTLQENLDELTQIYGFKTPTQAIEVILYEQKEFQRALSDAPHWVDGLYDGRIRVPIKNHQGDESQKTTLRQILSHELVHALFAETSGQRRLPPWFDEGMAQRFSCPNSGCKPFVFQANAGVFLKADEFEKSFLKADTLKAQRLYQQSLYLILTLESVGGSEILRMIIESTKPGSDLSSDALLKPVGVGFAALRDRAAERWKNKDTHSSGSTDP